MLQNVQVPISQDVKLPIFYYYDYRKTCLSQTERDGNSLKLE